MILIDYLRRVDTDKTSYRAKVIERLERLTTRCHGKELLPPEQGVILEEVGRLAQEMRADRTFELKNEHLFPLATWLLVSLR